MKPESVQAAIQAVPPDVAPLHAEVMERVARLYPQAELVLWYGVPAYVMPSGRLGVGHWKGGVSVYPGPSAVAAYVARVPGAEASKGAVRLRVGEPLGPAFDQLVRDAMEGP